MAEIIRKMAMRILVAGASSGMGETVARRLATDGHQVGLMARREQKLREIAAELNGVIAVSGDVSKPALEGGAIRCACRFYYPGVGGQRGGANARFGVFAYGQKTRSP